MTSLLFRVSRNVVVLLAILTGQAYADPIQWTEAVTLLLNDGTQIPLPPGVFVPEPDWLRLDKEVRRLQGTETRLRAENQKLRDLTEQPPMRILLGVGVGLAIGFGLGVGTYAYLTR